MKLGNSEEYPADMNLPLFLDRLGTQNVLEIFEKRLEIGNSKKYPTDMNLPLFLVSPGDQNFFGKVFR